MPKKKEPIKIIGLAREPTEGELDKALKAAGIKGVSFTPIQLHAFLLKLVLKGRITDKEIKLLSETYRDLIKEYWGKSKARR